MLETILLLEFFLECSVVVVVVVDGGSVFPRVRWISVAIFFAVVACNSTTTEDCKYCIYSQTHELTNLLRVSSRWVAGQTLEVVILYSTEYIPIPVYTVYKIN